MWVTSLTLWIQSNVDESVHMEGRVVFRQELPSEVPKKLRLLSLRPEPHHLSFAPHGSRNLPVALGMLLIPEEPWLCRSAGKGCLPTLSCPWAAGLPQTRGEA